MKQFFLLIFFGFCSIVNGFEFFWDEIHAKLQEPPPDWMVEQIHEDLDPFREGGVTIAQIKKTVQEVYKVPGGTLAGFVHYTISNNEISANRHSLARDDVRVNHVIEVLEGMAEQLALPDIDFLVAVWDSYDNPLYLERTHCPVFTMCKLKSNHKGVLFPEFRFFSYRQRLFSDITSASDRSLWEKKNPKAFWRGMTSGFNFQRGIWDYRPRARLVLFSREYPELLDAGFTSDYNLGGGVKPILEHYDLFRPWEYPVGFVNSKYLVSIDGNTFASNLWWQLISNCTVLKGESDFVEWFYKGLEPYVHYVPYEMDMSDFGGKIEWLLENDQEAKKIAHQGSAFGKEYLSNAGLVVYFYRLLHAYAEIFQPE